MVRYFYMDTFIIFVVIVLYGACVMFPFSYFMNIMLLLLLLWFYFITVCLSVLAELF